ncbi:peptidoglycan/xylan/chitin deacetylase (PgdA/CDA1 family) [Paenibacillus shirakamiensis]|uniref:Peptidoglycan/xylan/chitin deacetylase (PgdA/CDA1 family) n=1 Tax=Paenibacillus shirakamiensis TaxID=1265935 RepID=A0ABS4JF74_9BACL|nr:polysaccharide deacetylase [Paenibacillus shirakamiensis]MBP2000358.1 peptidoglycan/xylan/chitin deacetylase (PgdA/CDA1 family) [Paenibacillus shirakamiensis]
MYKKLSLTLFLILCLSFPQMSFAAGSTPAVGTITALLGVNDQLTELHPVMKNGNYYSPVRDVATTLHLQVSGTIDQVVLQDESGMSLVVEPQNQKAKLYGGEEVKTQVFVEGGKTWVPVSLIGRAFDYNLTYVASSFLIRLVKGPEAGTIEQFQSTYKAQIDQQIATNKKAAELAAKPVTPSPQPGKKPTTPAPKPNSGDKDQPTTQPHSKQPLYLSFDDGPSPHTSQLLQILDKYNVKATFFMLGKNIATYPSSIKKIVDSGHAVGLHGMSHVKNKFYKSPDAALAEMNDDNAQLKKATGITTHLVRSPYGSKPYLTQAFRNKLVGGGYHIWDWNVDSLDWKYKNDSTSIYNGVMKQVKAQHEKGIAPVILFHDQEATLKVLPRVLASLKAQGYSFELITSDMKPLNFWHDER